jgi:hypothetical protein
MAGRKVVASAAHSIPDRHRVFQLPAVKFPLTSI